jgi:hypothetical protein
LRVAGTVVDVALGLVHAAAGLRGHTIEVLAVRGPSHEDCIEHIERRFVPPARRQILVVTLDPHNAPRLKKQRNYLRPNTPQPVGAEGKITDPAGSQLNLAFHDLMDLYLAADTAAGLEAALYARLSA